MNSKTLRCGALLVAVTLLSACGGGNDAAPAAETPPAPVAQPAAGPAVAPAPVPPVAGAGSIEVAEVALRDQRLFTPPGDNAFELFVLASEANPDARQARDALTDLFPYAVLHVEQRTIARDAADARRVLDLMTRTQPEAPALERLERELERLERRLATEAAAPPPAPAPPAATPVAAPAPPPAAVPAPEPVAPPPPAAAVPAPPPAAAPAPVATPTPAPAPVAAEAARPVPRVLRQPTVRYPEQAMRQGIEGEVTLDFQIEADGSVSDVRVVESQPSNIFDREALQVIRRTRFEPPEQPMRARRTIEFNLQR